jgi:CO dehydrogenase/acetyl-CoA synthase alpha subunit
LQALQAFSGYEGEVMRQGCVDALAIEEGDIAELEEIDPFRAWREEPDFEISIMLMSPTHSS